MDNPSNSKSSEATSKTSSVNPLINAVKNKTKISTTTDDNTLLDIHVGNPLRKITKLLEEIKKQKAFSFTLKGSLGLMGVVLAPSFLGFFGTTHALCDKGIQTHIGKMKILQVTDPQPDHLLGKIITAFKYYQSIFTLGDNTSPRYRYILETPTHQTIHLNRGRDVTLSTFKDQAVFITGVYDSCSLEIDINTPDAVELYR